MLRKCENYSICPKNNENIDETTPSS